MQLTHAFILIQNMLLSFHAINKADNKYFVSKKTGLIRFGRQDFKAHQIKKKIFILTDTVFYGK